MYIYVFYIQTHLLNIIFFYTDACAFLITLYLVFFMKCISEGDFQVKWKNETACLNLSPNTYLNNPKTEKQLSPLLNPKELE